MSGPFARRALAGAAVLGGALAPFAGSPYRVRHARIDVERLAGVVAREEDHVTAIELARWIKERRKGLRVLDLRPAAAFDGYHIPSSENVPLASLAATAFRPADTLVLVSDGGAHAAQAWVFLQALGYRQTYFLRGGLGEWLDEVMSPALDQGGAAAERERIAALSRYFGGAPRSDGTQATRPPRRGGC